MSKYICEACAGQRCRAQADKRPQRCLHYEKEPCWCSASELLETAEMPDGMPCGVLQYKDHNDNWIEE